MSKDQDRGNWRARGSPVSQGRTRVSSALRLTALCSDTVHGVADWKFGNVLGFATHQGVQMLRS